MTPQQEQDIAARARSYIDEIIAINKKYGKTTTVPKETYERAVQDSADAFRSLAAR